MKYKQIIGSIILAAMVLLPITYANADNEKVLFDYDYTRQNISAKPRNMYTVNVPQNGNVNFVQCDDTGKTALGVNDTSASGGITVRFPIPELTGRFTIHTKFKFNTAGYIDFFDGVGTNFANNGFRIYKGAASLYLDNTTARNTLLFPKMNIRKDVDIEMWACVDTNTRKMNIYFKSPKFTEYKSTLPQNAELNGDTYCLRDFPIFTDRINAIKITTTTDVGTNYFDFFKAYEGFVTPYGEADEDVQDKASEEETNEVITAVKAPWLTRRETMDFYNSGVKSILSTESFVKTLETVKPTGAEYMPSEAAIGEALSKVRGQHPRIMFDSVKLEEIKGKLADPEYDFITKSLMETWEADLAKELYVYDPTHEGEIRVVGDTMQNLALVYKLTGDKKYYDKTMEWIKIACEMPMYGDGMGIAASHVLAGLGITYDYLYDELDESVKSDMRQAMITHGGYLWRSWVGDPGYLHNFGYTIAEAFAYMALALFDEDEYADIAYEWLIESQRFIATSLEVISPDGCSPEGTGYFSYGYKHLVRYCMVAEKWGFNPWKCEGFINSVKKYRLYMSFPYNYWTGHDNVAQFGDSYGYDYGGTMVGIMYYIASKTDDSEVLVWLANKFLETGIYGVDIMTLLYYDKNMPEKSPEALGYPTMGVMKDFGYVTSYADWSGNGSAIYFKSGFANGYHAMKYLRSNPKEPDFGFGHNHPDVNHFILFNKGDLMICDDTYSYKLTSQHNTLTVNGKGQMGDDAVWYKSPLLTDINHEPAYLKKTESYEDYDYFVGAGANAYDKSLGLKKYDRHMLFIKPGVLIVIDDIATKKKSDLELRFFSGTYKVYPLGDGYIANGDNTNMYVRNLTPQSMDMTVEKQGVYINRSPNNQRGVTAYTLRANDSALTNVMAFSWCDSDKIPAKIDFEKDGYNYKFTVEGKEYNVNIQTLVTSVKEAAKTAEVQENKLIGLNINDIPIELKDGVYEYNFNLDDYYYWARQNSFRIFAMDERQKTENVIVENPKTVPGTGKVTVKGGGEDKVYTVNVNKTVFDNIERLQMTPVSDKNSFSNSYKPSNLLDNRRSTAWRTGTTENHPIFDIGETKKLTGFDVAWRDNYDDGFDFVIKTSLDGVNFTEVYRGQANSKIEQASYYEFAENVEARYVEFIVDVRYSSLAYCVSEFGVYGQKD